MCFARPSPTSARFDKGWRREYDATRKALKGGMLVELLTAELLAHLPHIYGQEDDPDPIVHAVYQTLDSIWTWFVTEGSQEGDDFLFYGFVQGFDSEWSYFALSELKAMRDATGLPAERKPRLEGRRLSRAIFLNSA
jgi:hypothetical protein